MLCFIEASMFCMLIAIYFYLRLSVDMWPPPGTQLPHTLLPTLALIPLILSAVGSYWASEAAKQNSHSGMLKGMIVNVVLGLMFLGLRFAEFELSTLLGKPTFMALSSGVSCSCIRWMPSVI